MEGIKLCINCKHIMGDILPRCARSLDLVFGKPGALTCEDARSGDFCGAEATGFEQKEAA